MKGLKLNIKEKEFIMLLNYPEQLKFLRFVKNWRYTDMAKFFGVSYVAIHQHFVKYKINHNPQRHRPKNDEKENYVNLTDSL